MEKIIHLIAAARPNFMKVAPLYHALRRQRWAHPILVHTGQHYDVNMSDAFLQDLRLPAPDIHLGVGSGTHAEQMGNVMIAYERVLLDQQPDMVVVVGDVNSTVACTFATVKMNFRAPNANNAESARGSTKGHRPVVAHLEAGLRSFDRTMPEEINRLATDMLADVLWTPSPDADENLLREGITLSKVVRVGNIMIDSLEMLRDRIEAMAIYHELGLARSEYGVVTLHRPSNVDDPTALKNLCGILGRVSRRVPLVFPVHPRTRKNLETMGLLAALADNTHLLLLEPVSYIRFMNLVFNCRFVITDSGGIQEETTYLSIPCFTMRPNTERPITVERGTNQLCRAEEVEQRLDDVLGNNTQRGTVPEMWDGKTAERVVESIRTVLEVA